MRCGFACRLCAAREDEVPGAPLDQPLRGAHAERAGPAGDPVGGVREHERSRHAFASAVAERVSTSLPTWRACAIQRKAAGASCEPERAARAAGAGSRRPARPPARRASRRRGPRPLGPPRPGHRGGSARPGAQRPSAPATRCRACPARGTSHPSASARRPAGDEIARQGVEHHVHALPASGGKDVVGEGGRAGVEHMSDAPGAQQVPLGRRARRGEHLGTGPLGELHRGESHAPGGRMDQHSTSGSDPGHAMEAVHGGQERDRQRRRLVDGDARRDAAHEGCRHRDLGGRGCLGRSRTRRLRRRGR